GNIGDAPDFRLSFSGNGAMPLFIRTISGSDTTLIINGPDGQWYCDDDSFGDGDAQVRFGRPQSGVYDIWVGSFDGNPETILVITEIE
ncbi:MAG TPA: peptidase S1, partial [Brevundimonas sp.]|nr:peptidase S1 [Brevundimonas sp.]